MDDLTAQIETTIDKLLEQGYLCFMINRRLVADQMGMPPEPIFELFPYAYQWDLLKGKVYRQFNQPEHPTYAQRMQALSADYQAIGAKPAPWGMN